MTNQIVRALYRRPWYYSMSDNPATSAAPVIRVKFLARISSREWLRQLPGNSNRWGNCEFIFDSQESHYDWLVVYDDLPPRENERFSVREEKLACPQQQTILVTTEPSNIKVYGNAYTAQFGHVLTSQEAWALKHPGRIYSQPALHWFYGVGRHHEIPYDTMLNTQMMQKTKTISTVCSNKKQKHTLHNKRYYFVQKLQQRLTQLDVFGHGVRDMDDKAEALDQYRYHIAIENHVGLHHWTEKLSDAFLGFTLPFYFGCPNASDYFPEQSFIPIDINNLDEACSVITTAIENDEYSKRLPFIIEARKRVLEQYNIFAVLHREINRLQDACNNTSKVDTIVSRRGLRKKHPLTGLDDLYQKTRVRIVSRLRRNS